MKYPGTLIGGRSVSSLQSGLFGGYCSTNFRAGLEPSLTPYRAEWTKFRPISNRCCPYSGQFRRYSCFLHQTWATSTKFRLASAKFGSSRANLGRCRPHTIARAAARTHSLRLTHESLEDLLREDTDRRSTLPPDPRFRNRAMRFDAMASSVHVGDHVGDAYGHTADLGTLSCCRMPDALRTFAAIQEGEQRLPTCAARSVETSPKRSQKHPR